MCGIFNPWIRFKPHVSFFAIKNCRLFDNAIRRTLLSCEQYSVFINHCMLGNTLKWTTCLNILCQSARLEVFSLLPVWTGNGKTHVRVPRKSKYTCCTYKLRLFNTLFHLSWLFILLRPHGHIYHNMYQNTSICVYHLLPADCNSFCSFSQTYSSFFFVWLNVGIRWYRKP